MGGDDLDDDFDVLITEPIRSNNNNDNGDDDDDDNDDASSNDNDKDTASLKRKSKDGNTTTTTAIQQSQSKSKRQKKGNELLLRTYGIRIVQESVEIQSQALTEIINNHDNDNASKNISFPNHCIAKIQISPSISKPPHSSLSSLPMHERLTGIISKKQLKKPSPASSSSSPTVIIICVSARRAVQVLKELAPLRLHAIKLFAKHLTIEQQEQQLRNNKTTNSIAVGTPHRILTLATTSTSTTSNDSDDDDNDESSSSSSNDDDNDKKQKQPKIMPALSLKDTKVVLLDAFPNSKKFTVCTLPDTAPHVQTFLRDVVYPECHRRQKDHLRVGFI